MKILLFRSYKYRIFGLFYPEMKSLKYSGKVQALLFFMVHVYKDAIFYTMI